MGIDFKLIILIIKNFLFIYLFIKKINERYHYIIGIFLYLFNFNNLYFNIKNILGEVK